MAQSAAERFGGGYYWRCSESGRDLHIGEAICSAGPGQGFASIPWAMDHYERVMRLTLADTWLLKRLLRHAWEYKTLVYPCMAKIQRESGIPRRKLWDAIAHLKALSYLYAVRYGAGSDRRVQYDLSGFFAALAICIALDPCSAWARANGGPLSLSEYQRLVHVGPHDAAGTPARRFELDFDALWELGGTDDEE